MMNINTMSVAIQTDAELVGQTLSGNRDAFSQIVSRYQSLVCSLAYSATGSLAQSEDLAQENLHHRLETASVTCANATNYAPGLCGIARNRINNFLRREGREPNHQAESIEEISETHSPEPLPVDYTISQEEAGIPLAFPSNASPKCIANRSSFFTANTNPSRLSPPIWI